MTLIQLILRKILAAVTWRPILTVMVAIGLSVLSLLYTIHGLGFLTSQKDLISPDNNLVKLSEQLDQFEDYDTFIVAIENHDPQRSLSFLHALAPMLDADDRHYVEVFYRVDPGSMKPWALLYLDKKDLRGLRDNISANEALLQKVVQSTNVSSFLSLINEQMTSKMVGELFTGFLDDSPSEAEENPLDLSFLISALQSMDQYLDTGVYRSPWGSFFSGAAWDEDSEGYFWTENKRYLLMFITPAKVDNSFNKAQASLEALRQAIAQVRREFPDVQAGVTGQQALNVDEMTLALGGMSLATTLSIVGLLVLLVLFWRGFRRPAIEMIALLVALSLTFGLTTLVIGHLNILSVVFAPLLLGMGIDYGIHWLARYQEEAQNRTTSRKEALQSTMVKLGPGILLAGLTAAVSFFPLALTGFRGLVELGIISSMGMVMTTFTTLCLLPALTLLFYKTPRIPRGAVYVPSPLFRLTNRRAIVILIVSCSALGASLILARGVKFDLNMLRLQSKAAESVAWEMKLLEGSERSSMYGAVLAHSIEEVRRKTEALKPLPTVSELHSIDTLLPEDQEEKIGILKELQSLLPPLKTPRTIEQPVDVPGLRNTLGRIGFKMLGTGSADLGDRPSLENHMTQVRNLVEQIRRRLDTDSRRELQLEGTLRAFENTLFTDLMDKLETIYANVNNARPMEMSDLPVTLLQRFAKGNDLYLIRVFPKGNIWEPDILGNFVADLRSVDPDVIGDPVTLYTFTKAFRDACITAALYAVVFIFALLLLTFRNVVYALLAMTPLLVGTAWTMGLMRCFSVDFNLANSIFLPLIVGAGVEYGIIILQRWKQRVGHDPVLPSSTGKGVILAGLTTTVGFGSLTVASHQGIYSLGLLSTIGSLSVMGAAILFLPALLHLLPSLSTRWKIEPIEVPLNSGLEEYRTSEERQL